MNRCKWMAALLLGGACCGSAWAQGAAAPSAKTPQLTPMLDKSVMDLSADPCEDFYKYACGNWAAQHPIPADQPETDQFQNIDEFNRHQVRLILEESASAPVSAEARQLGDYYASCMDEAGVEKKSPAVMHAELALVDALRDKKQLPALMAHFALTGNGALFGFGPETDPKDATRKIAFLTQSGLGLPERDYYFRAGADDEKIRRQYVEHIERLLTLIGQKNAKQAAEAILKFETELARVSMDVTSMRDPRKVYHPMSVEELVKLAPGFDWKAYFAATGAPSFAMLDVNEPEFISGMDKLVAATDLDTLKNYLRLHVVSSMPGTTMPKAYDQEMFSYSRVFTGQTAQPPRWKRCSGSTEAALGESLGRLYVERNFAGDSKNVALAMIHDLEEAMRKDIGSLDWMSAETRQKALEKLQAIANNIGYPEKWRDYSRLQVLRGDYMANHMRAAEFESRRQLAKIGGPVDRSEWDMTPPTVNAYYDPTRNDINFPAGILQPAFFDAKSSSALNYGHMGAVVGHEITHGFDDQGAQYDAKGNLVNWWKSEDSKAFQQRTQCLVDEYSQFKVGDVNVKGELTLGENTADNGGLRIALLAYLARAAKQGVAVEKKDETGYTPLQQFFLGYAQNWCSAWRPDFERYVATTDPHSPSRFRANGALVNMQEFGQAFACKPNQAMTPAKRCRVW